MPKDVSKIATVSVSPYTAAFAAAGYSVAVDQWSNLTYAATVTANGRLAAVGHGSSPDAAARVGLPLRFP